MHNAYELNSSLDQLLTHKQMSEQNSLFVLLNIPNVLGVCASCFLHEEATVLLSWRRLLCKLLF